MGQANFLRRFISNIASKTKVFSPLLRLKDHEYFTWNEEHQLAFDIIKRYLSTPLVLIPPRSGKPIKLHISTTQDYIGSLLAQDNYNFEHVVFIYLSRLLNKVELNYSMIEKLCLVLYFTTKLRHYMLSHVTLLSHRLM